MRAPDENAWIVRTPNAMYLFRVVKEARLMLLTIVRHGKPLLLLAIDQY